MIRLHRLGHPDEPFHLNPDLILTVEAHPDTVVTLTTTTKILVAESPEVIVAAVSAWRSSILSAALGPAPRRRARSGGLALVRASTGEGAAAVIASGRDEEEQR